MRLWTFKYFFLNGQNPKHLFIPNKNWINLLVKWKLLFQLKLVPLWLKKPVLFCLNVCLENSEPEAQSQYMVPFFNCMNVLWHFVWGTFVFGGEKGNSENCLELISKLLCKGLFHCHYVLRKQPLLYLIFVSLGPIFLQVLPGAAPALPLS